MAKYLDSIQPVLLQDELDGGALFAAAFEERQELVQSFLSGPGAVAQERLRALDDASPHNWLDDNFWLKKTYLPSTPHKLQLVPEDVVTDEGQGFTPWQIRRAACLVQGILDFKHRMESQELYPDTTRVGIWLRHCTSAIFNVCRVPQRGCDYLTTVAAASSPWASTIVIMAHDFFYALRVFDPETGAPLGKIVEDVLKRREQGQTAVRVGVLSSDERDAWAENYAHLRFLSSRNARSLDAIQESLFLLSLDHWPAPSIPLEETNLHLVFPNPVPCDLHQHQQRTRAPPALQNRFFDTPLQLIVERTTRAGACGEHAAVDALIPSVASGVALSGGMEGAPFAGSETAESKMCGRGEAEFTSRVHWERLDFVTSSHIVTAIADATRRAEALVADSDRDVLYFKRFGGDEIQHASGYPPDAFVQLAMQLAYYRIHGRTAPVYETALTRSFHHGRTETIRSLTRESFAFVLACGSGMDQTWEGNPVAKREGRDTDEASPASPSSLRALLISALRAHAQLTRAAIAGRGIDRHLRGLCNILGTEWSWLDGGRKTTEHMSCTRRSEMSREHENQGAEWEPGHRVALFEDPVFYKSRTWQLSTSGLREGWYFRGTGFGAPFADGYGTSLDPLLSSIKFCIDSKYSCSSTSTNRFMGHLHYALTDMWGICTSNWE
ncbi:acyltransferase ChoActase/COT/CPT [Pisolithus marmoratus]|nr:acyltransferase ChoActase/COT/CPT [Pisolithus marmoratus]